MRKLLMSALLALGACTVIPAAAEVPDFPVVGMECREEQAAIDLYVAAQKSLSDVNVVFVDVVGANKCRVTGMARIDPAIFDKMQQITTTAFDYEGDPVPVFEFTMAVDGVEYTRWLLVYSPDGVKAPGDEV